MTRDEHNYITLYNLTHGYNILIYVHLPWPAKLQHKNCHIATEDPLNPFLAVHSHSLSLFNGDEILRNNKYLGLEINLIEIIHIKLEE